MYCIHKNIHEAELPRRLPHRDVRGAGVVLNPCMGGHHIVTCNGTADDLTTNGKVLGVIHEIAEDWAVPGPFSRLECE